MSYDIVKSIAIKDDKVYITSAANNVSPRTFERWESKHFSEVYQKEGMAALLKGLAADVWEGNFHLQKGSQMCRNLQAAMDVLTYNKEMRSFLDTGRASQFISDFVMNILGKGPMPDVSKLYALRMDKDAVIDICKNNPVAFHYAAPNITADREAAREYILNCRDKIMFSMPSKFAHDKELAKMALVGNGCVYRNLNPSLQADKEIIRLAFDPSRSRQYFEHLPDLIPEAIRNDKEFMKELVVLCPKMHLFRTPDLLADKDIMKAWFGTGQWTIYKLREVPKEVLKDPDVQNSLFSSPADPELKESARQHLSQIGVYPAKQSLSDVLKSAESKAAAQGSPAPSIIQEPER